MKNNIFRVKSIEKIIDSAKNNPLKKTLGAFDLVLIAIGCTIGTGIFVFTGIAAAKYAGPGISLSYALAAIACMLAGLAYIELAAMMPVAGSAYTYSYAVLGEFTAWIVATALILEYMLGASSVAAGWSGYFVGLLKAGGVFIPEYLTKPPVDGGIINLPAVLITFFLASLLIRGTKTGINLNKILVAIKLGAVFLFLYIAVPHIKLINWINFTPFGFHGVIVGAATVFLAYIGFDAVATAAEECKNPNRDIPIGIIGGLLVCTILYVSVALVLTGITSYSELNNPEPLAYALRQNGSNIGSAILATGAVAGISSVLLVLIYANSRIFFVISRDGLMPKFFSKVHPKYDTPYLSCIAVSIAIALIAGFCRLETIWQISSLGALIAFFISSFVVLILRIKKPELRRPFKCPMLFVIAPLSILFCGYLILSLLFESGASLFFTLILISILIYFGYSYKKSPINSQPAKATSRKGNKYNQHAKRKYRKPYNQKTRSGTRTQSTNRKNSRNQIKNENSSLNSAPNNNHNSGGVTSGRIIKRANNNK